MLYGSVFDFYFDETDLIAPSFTNSPYSTLNLSSDASAYWNSGNGKVQFGLDEDLGDFDKYGFGRTCWSNYWHNSVFAMNEPELFRSKFAMKVCPGGQYANCTQYDFSDMSKVPSIFLTVLYNNDEYNRSADSKGVQIEIKPQDYIALKKNPTTGKMEFYQLLIGDVQLAIKNNACPMDSKFGIGNLFHKVVDAVYIQKASADGNSTITQIALASNNLKEVTIAGQKLKNAVVWLGCISVALFLIGILICKSMSTKPGQDDFNKAPHATIGNGSSKHKASGEEYQDEEESD